MSERKIRGVYFPMGRYPEAIEVVAKPYGNDRAPNLLRHMYEIIGCELVEKVTIADQPHGVDIVCDEEALLRERNQHDEPIAFNRTWLVGEPPDHAIVDIRGHAIAVGFDEDTGDWVSLTPEGVVDACKRVVRVATSAGFVVTPDFHPSIEQALAWIDLGKPW